MLRTYLQLLPQPIRSNIILCLQCDLFSMTILTKKMHSAEMDAVGTVLVFVLYFSPWCSLTIIIIIIIIIISIFFSYCVIILFAAVLTSCKYT